MVQQGPQANPTLERHGDSPVVDPASPEVSISGDGNLVILDQATKSVIWSTRAITTTNDTVAVLPFLNNGNNSSYNGTIVVS